MKNSEALREMSTASSRPGSHQYLCYRIPDSLPNNQYAEIKALIGNFIEPHYTFERYLEEITKNAYQEVDKRYVDQVGDPRYDFVQDMRARLCIFLAEQEEAKGK